jgi:hypothetical protein
LFAIEKAGVGIANYRFNQVGGEQAASPPAHGVSAALGAMK